MMEASEQHNILSNQQKDGGCGQAERADVEQSGGGVMENHVAFFSVCTNISNFTTKKNCKINHVIIIIYCLYRSN